MRLEFDLTIDRPLEDVFAYVSDVERVPDWAAPALEREKVSAGPVGVGTRYRAVDHLPGRRVEFTEVITHWEPRERVGLRMQAPFNADVGLRFRPTDEGGTHIHLSLDMKPSGLMGLLTPLLRVPVRRMFKKDLESLKRILESGATQGGSE